VRHRPSQETAEEKEAAANGRHALVAMGPFGKPSLDLSAALPTEVAGGSMRRLLVALTGAVLAGIAAPAAVAQERPARIVYVTGGDPATRTQWIERFHEGMRDFGGRNGETYHFEVVGAKGRFADLPALIQPALERKPDVILVSTTPASLAVKAATSSIPVVFVAVGDPTGVGLIGSIARPEGNVTGLTNASVELPGKRLQLLAELIPGLRRVAVLVNPNDENAQLQIERTRDVADGLGIVLDPIAPIRNAAEMEPAYRSAVERGAQAAVRLTDPVATQLRPDTIRLAAAYRLPTIYAFREDVTAGGLIAYGADQGEIYHRAAYFVTRILGGVAPSELPVEQPTRFELLVNVRTARDLGLSVPDAILARSDEIIE
jgi:putative ABC transport system substrate-binding protein